MFEPITLPSATSACLTQRGHDRRRQLRQRGAQRHQRQADHSCPLTPYSRAMIDALSTSRLGAQRQADEAQHQKDDDAPPRHVRVRALDLVLGGAAPFPRGGGGSHRAPHRTAYRPSAASRIRPDQKVKVPTKASAMNRTPSRSSMKMYVLRVSHPLVCRTGEDRRQAQHQQDVRRVRAHHIAQRQPRHPSASTAPIEISSSGAEVPKATMVRLTISAGTPTRRLRFTAPLTSASPASSKMTRPSACKCPDRHLTDTPRGRGTAPCRS